MTVGTDLRKEQRVDKTTFFDSLDEAIKLSKWASYKTPGFSDQVNYSLAILYQHTNPMNFLLRCFLTLSAWNHILSRELSACDHERFLWWNHKNHRLEHEWFTLYSVWTTLCLWRFCVNEIKANIPFRSSYPLHSTL